DEMHDRQQSFALREPDQGVEGGGSQQFLTAGHQPALAFAQVVTNASLRDRPCLPTRTASSSATQVSRLVNATRESHAEGDRSAGPPELKCRQARSHVSASTSSVASASRRAVKISLRSRSSLEAIR